MFDLLFKVVWCFEFLFGPLWFKPHVDVLQKGKLMSADGESLILSFSCRGPTTFQRQNQTRKSQNLPRNSKNCKQACQPIGTELYLVETKPKWKQSGQPAASLGSWHRVWEFETGSSAGNWSQRWRKADQGKRRKRSRWQKRDCHSFSNLPPSWSCVVNAHLIFQCYSYWM